MVAKLPIKVVLRQSVLNGSKNPEVLQRVATVYIGGQEYRVSAPPQAKGDVLEWIPHLTVRQSAGFNSEIEVHDEFGELALTAVKEELEKQKPNARNARVLPPNPGGAEPSMSDPLRILKQSIKLVPANKYAFGVLGIVAAASLSIKLAGGNWFVALAGGVVMLVGMVILRVFAGTGTGNSRPPHPPALTTQALTWLCIGAFAIVLGMFLGRLYVLLFPGEGIRHTKSSQPESTAVDVAKLIATDKSEIVARVFMRGMMPLPPAAKAEFSPIFQEFFYDWILTLEPEGPSGDISIILKEPQKHEESIKIMPDIAAVSGPIGKWMSGFQEKARQNPDYYETAIRFPEGLDKDRPAKIVFRRPIRIKDETTFTLQDFSRTLEVSASKANVVKHYYDETKQFELISLQLRTLLAWKYSGANSPPVPVRENPTSPLPPLGRGEIETTLEVRCDSEAIGKKIVVQQLEARKKGF